MCTKPDVFPRVPSTELWLRPLELPQVRTGTGRARCLELLIGLHQALRQPDICAALQLELQSLNQARPCDQQRLRFARRVQDAGGVQTAAERLITSQPLWDSARLGLMISQRLIVAGALVPHTGSSRGQLVWAAHSNRCFKFITGLWLRVFLCLSVVGGARRGGGGGHLVVCCGLCRTQLN